MDITNDHRSQQWHPTIPTSHIAKSLINEMKHHTVGNHIAIIIIIIIIIESSSNTINRQS